jgi:serine/threonine protein kinase
VFSGLDQQLTIELRGGLDLLARLGSSTTEKTREQAPFRGKGSSTEDPLSASNAALPDIPGYEVLKQIGRGGMGIVYKAIQKSTKRLVALKLLLEGPFASDNARKRFEREIALAAQLKHANIIPIYDSGQADGRMYYAMEHVFGLSLGDYIRAQESDLKGRLQLFLKVCGPVSYAHQRGVIHRDLKPTNILVDGDGEPHVLDFGLAKAGLLGEVNTSVTAQIVGTPAYMSPEQAAGDPTGVDTRVDVYALGVVLYEIVTGQMPYDTNVAMGKVLHNIAHAEPTHPSKHVSRIDGDLSTIMLKALEKRKEDRYQSIDAAVATSRDSLRASRSPPNRPAACICSGKPRCGTRPGRASRRSSSSSRVYWARSSCTFPKKSSCRMPSFGRRPSKSRRSRRRSRHSSMNSETNRRRRGRRMMC